MGLENCEALIAEKEPDLYAVWRLANGPGRDQLMGLQALNIHIRKAAWASNQPLVAEMRLQWWCDGLEALGRGQDPYAHPVFEECAFLRGQTQLCADLAALADARRWDIWAEPFADHAALWAHLEATGGRLTGLSARVLGADAAGEEVAVAYGTATALAGWFEAVPSLLKHERPALPDTSAEAIAALAQEGLARIAKARKQRGKVARSAAPALLAHWNAPQILAQVAQQPLRVLSGKLGVAEVRKRGALAWRALSGRW